MWIAVVSVVAVLVVLWIGFRVMENRMIGRERDPEKQDEVRNALRHGVDADGNKIASSDINTSGYGGV